MTAPSNATHWTPASPASSRRVYSLDRPGGAHDDTLDPHDLPEQLRGDEAIEGRLQTWAVLGRGTLAGGELQVIWLCRDGEEGSR